MKVYCCGGGGECGSEPSNIITPPKQSSDKENIKIKESKED